MPMCFQSISSMHRFKFRLGEKHECGIHVAVRVPGDSLIRLRRGSRASQSLSLACESLQSSMMRFAAGARVAQRRCMSHQLRPPNWKALAPPLPNFARQPATLPSLPVPSLPATLQKLKDSLRPLARSTQEFVTACHRVDDFARHDGPGPILQQLLLQRKKEREHWLEEWWDDLAYLAYRDSVNSCFSASFNLSYIHLPGCCQCIILL